MKWYNPVSWFKNSEQECFVEVMLDGVFGKVYDSRPDLPHVLRVVEASRKEVEAALSGRSFNWGTIHSHWRHYLEIEGFFAATFQDVKKYLH